MSTLVTALSLRSRVIRAGVWTLGGHATSQALRLASNLIMTRLLVPETFGVMALATVFMIGLVMFSDLGLRQVAIQNTREDATFLNTLWLMQIARGIGICLLGLALAAGLAWAAGANWLPAGSTYAKPELPGVLAMLSFTAIIAGFESTKLLTANRKLALGQITLIELVSQIAGLVLMVAWALHSASIDALVAGAIVAGLARTLLSHVWLPGPGNRLQWETDSAREIFRFGKWIFLTSIMGFLIGSGDRILLGWLIPAQTMGLYAIAVLLAGAMQEVVNKLIGSVAFPALGEIHRAQPARMRELYYQIRWPIDALCLTAAGLLFMAGEAIVALLYDSRYAGAGAMLEILSLSLFAIRYSVAGQFYLVLGRPKIMAFLMGLRLAVMAATIPLGFHYLGLPGAIWGIALAGIPGVLTTLFVFKRKIGLLDIGKEIRALLFLPAGLAAGKLAALLISGLCCN